MLSHIPTLGRGFVLFRFVTASKLHCSFLTVDFFVYYESISAVNGPFAKASTSLKRVRL